MEEIQVGEYVRTKNEGIKKIAYLRPNATVNRYAYFIGYDDDGDRLNGILKTTDIVKHSSNIIDLIEVGDLVKTNQGSIFEINEIRVSSFDSVIFADDYKIELRENDIKSIVTKEQFEEKEYIIKE